MSEIRTLRRPRRRVPFYAGFAARVVFDSVICLLIVYIGTGITLAAINHLHP